MNNKSLKKVQVINNSGFRLNPGKAIPPLRKGRYFIVDIFISGDAPKDFVKVYEYGKARKTSPHLWTPYIAKVGHKWYPIESITEYLMSRIGEVLGMDMAKSKLMMVGGQIRFLSRYFLKKEERLDHGAQIYSGFLNDEALVEEIESKGMARDFFTFQFTEQSIRHRFPAVADDIMKGFVKLLLFDAIVGNSDRHFYNWGVIVDDLGRQQPRFSPVYDTARGLFWNEREQKILDIVSDSKRLDAFLNKYTEKSAPKTGWEGEDNINHFRLIELLYEQDHRYCDLCEGMIKLGRLQDIHKMIDKEFSQLFSKARIFLIKKCLERSFERLNQIITKT